MQIIDYLAVGKENARTREYLRSVTGLADRQLRKEIEDAVKSGEWICNDEDGKGYYIAENLSDLYRSYKLAHTKEKSLRDRWKKNRKELKRNGFRV